MLLAIDIGNTNIVIGGIRDDKIAFEARIATDHIKTSDQYGVDIKNVLSLFDTKPGDIKGCIISSVVPPVFNSVQTGVRKVIGKPPMVVGPGIKTGLNMKSDGIVIPFSAETKQGREEIWNLIDSWLETEQ